MPLRDQHRFASPRARTVKQFRLLDADANARLGRDDLEATKDKSHARAHDEAGLHEADDRPSLTVTWGAWGDAGVAKAKHGTSKHKISKSCEA